MSQPSPHTAPSPPKASSIRRLLIWEEVEDRGLVRFRYELTDRNVLIRKVEDQPRDQGTTGRPPVATGVPEAIQHQIKDLEARGITYEIKDGRIMITGIPDREKMLLQVLQPEVDCWFEGCEELRAGYLKEVAAIEKDPNCAQENKAMCRKGAVIRKYRAKAEKKLAELEKSS